MVANRVPQQYLKTGGAVTSRGLQEPSHRREQRNGSTASRAARSTPAANARSQWADPQGAERRGEEGRRRDSPAARATAADKHVAVVANANPMYEQQMDGCHSSSEAANEDELCKRKRLGAPATRQHLEQKARASTVVLHHQTTLPRRAEAQRQRAQ